MRFNFLILIIGLVTQICGAQVLLGPTFKPVDSDGINTLSSTVYYTPIVTNDTNICNTGSMRDVIDTSGNVVTKLCKKNFDNLVLQGTMKIQMGKDNFILNYAGKRLGTYRFVKIDRCEYGFGRRTNCLQPMISVAAGSNYQVGQVLYVPAVAEKNLTLPDGRIHPGFFIVADSGQAITGVGRFDFFTGFLGAFDRNNTLANMGLRDKHLRKFKYYLIKRGSVTEQAVHRFYDFDSTLP